MQDPSFWNDQDRAQATIEKVNALKAWTAPFQSAFDRFNDVKELFSEAKEDEDLLQDFHQELVQIKEILDELEIKRMLSGELDSKNCFLSINAGAGGTESCDWAAMLARMYERWAQKKGWKVQVIDKLDGEVAGIKNITLKFIGEFAYGYCKAEKGVHRLVRISPFDSNARRHTSFASVDVTPEIDDDIEVDIKPDEIRIDTYRASGAGGQHVNTTDSAVRITHIPSGTVVTSQNERSQIQNRETCMKMLKSKLYELEVLKREEQVAAISGDKMDIAWGSQIRSYVFQPYTMVKDARTKYEETNIQSVMDGEIDGFVNAYLKERG